MESLFQSKPFAECPVCLQPYSRQERVPRLLHCKHTFCTPCLERLTVCLNIVSIRTVRCPICRWTSCLGPFDSPQNALWVDNVMWDGIPESDEEEEECVSDPKAKHVECLAPKHSKPCVKRVALRDKILSRIKAENKLPSFKFWNFLSKCRPQPLDC